MVSQSEGPQRTRWSGGLLDARETRLLAICAAAGLILGVVLALLPGSRFTATALADGGPGGSVDAALNVSPDVANRYVQTELVYIDILAPDFDQAMQAAGLPGSGVRANQEGATNVISLATQGDSADQAAQQANVALEVYIADWKQRTTEDLERLLSNSQTRIDEVSAQIQDLGTSAQDEAQRKGLLSELTRLTQEASDLQFRIGGVQAANRVVEQALPQNAVRTTSPVQLGVLGLLAGIVIALALIVFARVRRVSQQPRSGLR
jgi:hypothetical protein